MTESLKRLEQILARMERSLVQMQRSLRHLMLYLQARDEKAKGE
jgi:hypothetical protein